MESKKSKGSIKIFPVTLKKNPVKLILRIKNFLFSFLVPRFLEQLKENIKKNILLRLKVLNKKVPILFLSFFFFTSLPLISSPCFVLFITIGFFLLLVLYNAKLRIL